MIFETRGIVLKTLKYGETSLIAHIFTELFGIQAYLINGIRKPGKGSSANSMLQPASLLDMNVYHYELKNLQRIKDFRWSFLYNQVLSDITKNAVAMYMVELIYKCLKQPEPNPDLFHFCEDAFTHLDSATPAITANYPLFFCLHLAHFFGFRLQDNYNSNTNMLDLQEGAFTHTPPAHGNFLESHSARAVSQILKAQTPQELEQIKLNKTIRKDVLNLMQYYYAFHIQDFGTMKTLPVVQTILS